MWRTSLVLLALALAASANFQEEYAAKFAANLRNPLGGWNILSSYYQNMWNPVNFLLDGLSFEWDYYSIHDDNHAFTGIIGYLVNDPNGKLSSPVKLVPSGANLAINGQWVDGRRNANFLNFGTKNYQASNTQRSWYAYKTGNAIWGRLTPISSLTMMNLQGSTDDYEWNLNVTQLYPERNSLPIRNKTWMVGDDINTLLIGVEHWTVNMIWPSTKVVGWMVDKQTNTQYSISGHGYRENSFGRWAFCFGGWDFYFMTDVTNKLQITLQTYHFNTQDLDYMETDFVDPKDGLVHGVRFRADANQLGWYHQNWTWDTASRQALPTVTHIIGKADDYVVDVTASIGVHYYPMLSNVTVTTDIYVIDCLFPTYTGTISHISDGSLVASFENVQGGGEFALPKSIIDAGTSLLEQDLIEAYFSNLFSHDFPN